MSRRSQKLVEYGKPLLLVREQVPTAPPGGAVVQVAFAGVCHSDVHAADGLALQAKPPIILGHEISGTVRDLDPGVKSDVKVGDRVVVYSMGGCSACSRCAEGRPIDCLNNVRNVNGAFIDGGFSDYVVCPDSKLLLKVPDSVAMDTACLLPCSGLTAYNAVTKIVPTVADVARHTDNCAVILVGAGGLGLWAVQIAKQLLPSNVRLVCADVDVDKLASAKDAGCDVTVHWEKGDNERSLVAATRKACGASRCAVAAIDFVNLPETFSRVERILGQGGIHAMVGIMAKPGVVGTIPLTPFVLTNHTLAAVAVGRVQQLEEVMALVANGKIKPPPISHHPLESAWDVLQMLKAGKVKGRAVLKLSKL
ncbi:alcohol dehydrogenase-like [Branchiostoma lanceolatum]|uniref:alcohol dehydrogenase-like n=1 Tax=Branchiostoma lanceolatum TaxID=7740 RepID=UPI0034540EB6